MARRVSGKRKKGKCVRRARLGQLGGGVAAAMSADLEKNNKRYSKRASQRLDKRLERLDAKGDAPAVSGDDEKAPNSFVLHRGIVGKNVQRLVRDVRACMEPFTATNLKPMRRNKLKDFIVNARPLGVSHMLMLSKSDTHVNMRMCRLPHGPTLTFQVVAYTLSRDIAAAARRPVAYEQHLRTQPLIVMNEFGATDAAGHPTPPPRHLRLTQTIMQNMFSKLRVDAAVQSNIKRCILINHDTDTDLIDWRHYIIKTTPQLTANRSVRKLTADVKPSKAVPDLSRYADISDFVLKPEPAGSDSETDGELTLVDTEPSTLSKRALPTTVMSGKSRVKLVEIGPRMTLRLTKIEEGVCAGAVMYHAFEQRTSDEQREQRMQLLMAQQQRTERRAEQQANVERKLKEKERHRQECAAGLKRKVQATKSDVKEAQAAVPFKRKHRNA